MMHMRVITTVYVQKWLLGRLYSIATYMLSELTRDVHILITEHILLSTSIGLDNN